MSAEQFSGVGKLYSGPAKGYFNTFHSQILIQISYFEPNISQMSNSWTGKCLVLPFGVDAHDSVNVTASYQSDHNKQLTLFNAELQHAIRGHSNNKWHSRGGHSGTKYLQRWTLLQKAFILKYFMLSNDIRFKKTSFSYFTCMFETTNLEKYLNT